MNGLKTNLTKSTVRIKKIYIESSLLMKLCIALLLMFRSIEFYFLIRGHCVAINILEYGRMDYMIIYESKLCTFLKLEVYI